mmetsp:Transcript_136540/g.353978  ORF Transcript_136540/g.353978 Transcript_136540/m.353978 type:complete len:235 (-) Transcript_136540:990-1694(-)
MGTAGARRQRVRSPRAPLPRRWKPKRRACSRSAGTAHGEPASLSNARSTRAQRNTRGTSSIAVPRAQRRSCPACHRPRPPPPSGSPPRAVLRHHRRSTPSRWRPASATARQGRRAAPSKRGSRCRRPSTPGSTGRAESGPGRNSRKPGRAPAPTQAPTLVVLQPPSRASVPARVDIGGHHRAGGIAPHHCSRQRRHGVASWATPSPPGGKQILPPPPPPPMATPQQHQALELRW